WKEYKRGVLYLQLVYHTQNLENSCVNEIFYAQATLEKGLKKTIQHIQENIHQTKNQGLFLILQSTFHLGLQIWYCPIGGCPLPFTNKHFHHRIYMQILVDRLHTTLYRQS
ncbi:hypothetical protein ACJX0J_019978, partial [Zea mays]